MNTHFLGISVVVTLNFAAFLQFFFLQNVKVFSPLAVDER